MRLIPSQIEISTLIARLQNGDLNLQPDFQRGEVWNLAKKQRLIDSILRDWHVPPIHLIEDIETAKQEVLDGQQRLTAIMDFVEGDIRVDGSIEPIDPKISSLDGLTYSELPDAVRRKFNRFIISINAIIDFNPEEPGELFYRLNQPVSLTSAEQRNAFFGVVRHQVRDLARLMEQSGLNKDFIGFSNSRMAFDDVIARVCYAVDLGSIREKITSPMLASKYRSNKPFSHSAIDRVSAAIKQLASPSHRLMSRPKLNRATLFSWLWFTLGAQTLTPSLDDSTLSDFFAAFELRRRSLREGNVSYFSNLLDYMPDGPLFESLLLIYEDRSSSRVTDAISVLSRDVILWTYFSQFIIGLSLDYFNSPQLKNIYGALKPQNQSGENYIDQLVSRYGWGIL